MATVPLTVVIFGASGDLTARKLIPSLYNLARKRRLPDELRIVGVSRTPFADDAYRDKLKDSTRRFAGSSFEEASWDDFARRIFYVAADAAKPGGLDALQKWFGDKEGTDAEK